MDFETAFFYHSGSQLTTAVFSRKLQENSGENRTVLTLIYLQHMSHSFFSISSHYRSYLFMYPASLYCISDSYKVFCIFLTFIILKTAFRKKGFGLLTRSFLHEVRFKKYLKSCIFYLNKILSHPQ